MRYKKEKISRKNYPVLFYIAFVIILFLLLLLFVEAEMKVRKNNANFDQLFDRYEISDRYNFLVDKETGVMYLERLTDYQYGITPLLKANGTPRTWAGEE